MYKKSELAIAALQANKFPFAINILLKLNRYNIHKAGIRV